jgi:AhpC/TSA family
MSRPEATPGARYGRYVALLGLLILVLLAINTAVNKPSGIRGVEPGHQLPPFAVPLALGDLNGAANVATHANEGEAGRVPACTVRGPEVLNVCQLYEQGPVVLALFVDAGSCADVLSDLQALAPSFPGVQIAAVAIKGNRDSVRKLVHERHLSLPVGIDIEGALATVYKVVSCPQVTFAYPGGVVQSSALLARPTRATLRARLEELVAAARARGWRGGAA